MLNLTRTPLLVKPPAQEGQEPQTLSQPVHTGWPMSDYRGRRLRQFVSSCSADVSTDFSSRVRKRFAFGGKSCFSTNHL